MKAKVILYRNDGETEGKYPVKIILSHKRKIRRKTITHTKVYDWDENRHLPKPSHPDYEDLYDYISNIERKAQRMEFKDLENFDMAFKYLIPEARPTINFLEYGEKRAKDMEQQGRTGNARAYRLALKELDRYQSPVFFKNMTKEFLEGFKEYKLNQGLKNTSIRSYLYAFQAIYRHAVDNGAASSMDPFKGLFKSLPVQKRRARNAYLEKEQIQKLELAEFKNKTYNLARDLVLLQFYFGGLDFIDLTHLKREQLHKGRIFLKRAKLGNRGYEFDLLIPDKAKPILKRLEGKHKEYFFDFPRGTESYMQFREKIYKAMQYVKKMEEIETAPRDTSFTLKTMRHTFATLGKFARIEEDLLRELMGHERNDIDTVYKDKYPEAERDAAQRLIIG